MGSVTPGKVLLVDDSELVIAIVSDGLDENGWPVAVARSGAEALALLDEEKPEVVVCDLHMPDMNGFEVLKAVSRRDDQLPVIILSSDEDLSAVLGAVREGAFDYIVKSDIGPLLASIERAVRHYRMARENRRLQAQLAEQLSALDQQNQMLSREITDRVKAEKALAAARDQALDAARAKSSFLANMTHELRTPLHAIRGYTELLLEEATDLGYTEFMGDLKKIQKATSHLMGVINDILDLAKLESGKVSLHTEPVDLQSFVEDLETNVRPLAEKNGNKLTLQVEPGLKNVRTDSRKLLQCLVNLLGNACKFTQNGRVSLEVARDERGGHGVVRFAVQDTGIGMSPAQQLTIFEEFSQVDTSVTRHYEGTGLGLAITQRLTQVLGGTIEVRSAQGQGSTFTLFLPDIR